MYLCVRFFSLISVGICVVCSRSLVGFFFFIVTYYFIIWLSLLTHFTIVRHLDYFQLFFKSLRYDLHVIKCMCYKCAVQ